MNGCGAECCPNPPAMMCLTNGMNRNRHHRLHLGGVENVGSAGSVAEWANPMCRNWSRNRTKENDEEGIPRVDWTLDPISLFPIIFPHFHSIYLFQWTVSIPFQNTLIFTHSWNGDGQFPSPIALSFIPAGWWAADQIRPSSSFLFISISQSIDWDFHSFIVGNLWGNIFGV